MGANQWGQNLKVEAMEVTARCISPWVEARQAVREENPLSIPFDAG